MALTKKTLTQAIAFGSYPVNIDATKLCKITPENLAPRGTGATITKKTFGCQLINKLAPDFVGRLAEPGNQSLAARGGLQIQKMIYKIVSDYGPKDFDMTDRCQTFFLN